jgi:hypothetical protein
MSVASVRRQEAAFFKYLHGIIILYTALYHTNIKIITIMINLNAKTLTPPPPSNRLTMTADETRTHFFVALVTLLLLLLLLFCVRVQHTRRISLYAFSTDYSYMYTLRLNFYMLSDRRNFNGWRQRKPVRHASPTTRHSRHIYIYMVVCVCVYRYMFYQSCKTNRTKEKEKYYLFSL